MASIEIDYRLMTYIIIGLFALVGFTRGWLREAFTTILLMFLVILLAQPELAKKIMLFVGGLILTVLAPIVEGNPDKFQGLVDTIKGLFNSKNPYGFMMLVTLFLIFVSYSLGRMALNEGKLAPLSRLLGGTLGALNGFVCLSLVREYLLARIGVTLPAGPVGTSAAIQAANAPQRMAVEIKNLYSTPRLSGGTLALLLALGFVILVFFLREVQASKARRSSGTTK